MLRCPDLLQVNKYKIIPLCTVHPYIIIIFVSLGAEGFTSEEDHEVISRIEKQLKRRFAIGSQVSENSIVQDFTRQVLIITIMPQLFVGFKIFLKFVYVFVTEISGTSHFQGDSLHDSARRIAAPYAAQNVVSHQVEATF